MIDRSGVYCVEPFLEGTVVIRRPPLFLLLVLNFALARDFCHVTGVFFAYHVLCLAVHLTVEYSIICKQLPSSILYCPVPHHNTIAYCSIIASYSHCSTVATLSDYSIIQYK